MHNKDMIHEYLLQARPIVDIATKKIGYMYDTKGGFISQESRNKARKKNRKKRK